MNIGDLVLVYLRTIESHDLDAVAALLHDDVVVTEHPNKLNPAGARYDKAALRAAGERGAAILDSERYDVRGLIVEGNRACVQTTWTGVLKNGKTMAAQICSVIEVRDGTIWRQEQYDCFP